MKSTLKTSALSQGITRRGLLAMAAVPLLPLASVPAATEIVAGSTRPASVIGALEAHGLWATSPLWAFDIHGILGARTVMFGHGEALGPQRVEHATQLALAGMQKHLAHAAGAVVIVMARPSATLLRDAKRALNHVRDVLPLSAYGVFSPVPTAEYGEEIVVSVSLGW